MENWTLLSGEKKLEKNRIEENGALKFFLKPNYQSFSIILPYFLSYLLAGRNDLSSCEVEVGTILKMGISYGKLDEKIMNFKNKDWPRIKNIIYWFIFIIPTIWMKRIILWIIIISLVSDCYWLWLIVITKSVRSHEC